MSKISKSNVPRIIFDCDLGTDDAVALYLLLLAERKGQVKIEMIVCTRGNTTLKYVCDNVVRLLEIANRTDIPIYKGSYDTILPRYEEDEFYHGVDGFGDLEYDKEPNLAIIKQEPAVVAMHNLIKENPQEITYICIGPLTNLALLLRMYENVEDQFKKVYIMGGNHFGIGNVSQAAEFNFHMDPEAAHVVLACLKCPVHLLTWECCLVTKIPMMWRMEKLSNNLGGKTWQFIDKAEKAIYKNLKDFWQPCDAYLIAALLYPNIILKSSLRHVDVELAGRLTRGQVAIDHVNKKAHNVFVIEEINYQYFQELMLEAYTQL